MTFSSVEPKALFEALIQGAPVPFELASEQLEAARAWARSGEAPAEGVAALPAPLALAVLEGTVRARQPALAEALTRSANAVLCKAAKKALYQLRSLGVRVDKAEPIPVAPVPAPTVEAPPALLSALTGNGERALLLTRPVRGGLEVFQAVFTDEAGIVELSAGELSHGHYRRQLKAMRQTPSMLEVSPERARSLLGHAAALNLASRTPFPPGTEPALRRLDVRPQLVPLVLPVADATEEGLTTRGALLHDEPEIAPWLPPEPQLRELAAKMAEVESSPLVLSPAQRKEQLSAQLEAMAAAFFDPRVRALYAGRLWSTAEVFEHTGRAEAAALARAEAKRLFHGAGGSRFAVFLFEKVVRLSERARAGQPLPNPGERLGSSGLVIP